MHNGKTSSHRKLISGNAGKLSLSLRSACIPGNIRSPQISKGVELERDFVYVQIDSQRAIEGAAVIGELRQTGVGLPWMAILDAKGIKLADSDSPNGNVRFPAEPEKINWFIDKMLKPTAQRLSAEDLDRLRKALLGTAQHSLSEPRK